MIDTTQLGGLSDTQVDVLERARLGGQSQSTVKFSLPRRRMRVIVRNVAENESMLEHTFDDVSSHRMVDRWLIVVMANGNEQIFPSDIVVTAISERVDDEQPKQG